MKNYGKIMKYVRAAAIVGTLALSGCDVLHDAFTPGLGPKVKYSCEDCHSEEKTEEYCPKDLGTLLKANN